MIKKHENHAFLVRKLFFEFQIMRYEDFVSYKNFTLNLQKFLHTKYIKNIISYVTGILKNLLEFVEFNSTSL